MFLGSVRVQIARVGKIGNFLGGPAVRLHTSTAGVAGSIPGCRTKIPHANKALPKSLKKEKMGKERTKPT